MVSGMAFQKQLKSLVAQCPANVASWSDDGLVYEIRDPIAFRAELAKLFKSSSERSQGVLIGFCRALKAFGFEFSAPGVNNEWKFWHPEGVFSCSSQEKEFVMTAHMAHMLSRSTSKNVENVRSAVEATERSVSKELANLSSQLAVIKGLVNIYVQRNTPIKRKADFDEESVATATTKAMRKKAMFETAGEDSDGSESVSSLA